MAFDTVTIRSQGAQKIEAKTDRHIWADSYERRSRDVLLPENEIARSTRNNCAANSIPRNKSGSLGENDRALAWLERGFQERSPWMLKLKIDPRLDPLRGDARFADLMRRMHFTP